MDLRDVGVFEHAWIWGIPLIAITVMVHVVGLGAIRALLGGAFEGGPAQRPRHLLSFASVMGLTVTLTTILHLGQALIWALAYLWLGALPGFRAAMVYSLNALTSFGHTSLALAPEWEILGALEALNGIMMFTLSGAFLFGMIQRAWPRLGE
ncbi:hypothetical protein [Sediminicoccus sp. KRV36]|uniref:hypothetical protein n=1 Tax=Sediminicoccus sp. KRV36 TaxID=3133721 RepID=UPI00200CC5E2|nr:hypothetical protein [Sediminicoccus rosea]UPY36231.1 hypothetical protein LHU95_18730 [Sediminicoccus rosea]